jgi:hypothetical protein
VLRETILSKGLPKGRPRLVRAFIYLSISYLSLSIPLDPPHRASTGRIDKILPPCYLIYPPPEGL